MALWEHWAPKRRLAVGRTSRWPGNLGVLAVDVLLVRILFPTAAVGAALVCEARGWGLFNVVPVPFVAATLVSVVLLDLAIYLQHVLFHAVPVLWRLHRMHHADLDIDVTTGVRFHPVEILLSLLIKFARHRPARCACAGGADIRGAAERHVDVQPQQRAHAGCCRPHRAPAGGDPGHAPRASFDRARGNQQQFRFQFSLVGPAVRHLPAPSPLPVTTA